VIYIAPKSEKRNRAHWYGAMGSRGQDKMTESSESLNDVYMKKVFETAECENAE